MMREYIYDSEVKRYKEIATNYRAFYGDILLCFKNLCFKWQNKDVFLVAKL